MTTTDAPKKKHDRVMPTKQERMMGLAFRLYAANGSIDGKIINVATTEELSLIKNFAKALDGAVTAEADHRSSALAAIVKG